MRAAQHDPGAPEDVHRPDRPAAPQPPQVPVVVVISTANTSPSMPATALPSSINSSMSASCRPEPLGLDVLRLVPQGTSASATVSANGVGPHT